jgi:hypothetical protein
VPHLVKILLRHASIGFAIGLGAVLAIVYGDLGHIGDYGWPWPY